MANIFVCLYFQKGVLPLYYIGILQLVYLFLLARGREFCVCVLVFLLLFRFDIYFKSIDLILDKIFYRESLNIHIYK